MTGWELDTLDTGLQNNFHKSAKCFFWECRNVTPMERKLRTKIKNTVNTPNTSNWLRRAQMQFNEIKSEIKVK